MEKYRQYTIFNNEADEQEREKMTFYKPFNADILEGGSNMSVHYGTEEVAILSSN